MPELSRLLRHCSATLLLVSCSATVAPQTPGAAPNSTATPTEWINLLNEDNLDGWIVKFTTQQVGVNYKDTFRVENGILKVSYENYEQFGGEFGHIFYHQPYSSYRLRMEYRFTGNQLPGSPEWAYRNAGIMFHAQAPQTMAVDQEFPVCVELQMLGGNGVDDRPTANMCSPSSHVTIDGKLEKTHCVNSKSPTFHGDQWVTVELEVHRDEVIRHRVNGDLVFEYKSPILDSEDPHAKKLLENHSAFAMTNGYLALQAETHPVEYRNIRLLPLSENRP